MSSPKPIPLSNFDRASNLHHQPRTLDRGLSRHPGDGVNILNFPLTSLSYFYKIETDDRFRIIFVFKIKEPMVTIDAFVFGFAIL